MDSGGGDGAKPDGGGAAGKAGGCGGDGGCWGADGDDGGFCGSSNPPVTVLSPAQKAAAAVAAAQKATVTMLSPSSSQHFTSASGGAYGRASSEIGAPVAYSVDDVGVLFESQQSAVDSEYLYRCTQPSLNTNLHSDEVEVDDCLLTQQSNNLRKDKHVSVVENLSDTEGFLDDYSEVDGADGDSDSDEGFEYDMGEYRPADVEARRQEETELKLNSLKRKRADEQGHYEGESEVEELFPISDSEDSEGSDAFVPIATCKKKSVRKGPTSRSHGNEVCISNPDYFPSDDHYFEISDDSEINTRKIGRQVKTASSNRHPRHLQQHNNSQQQLQQAAGHTSKPAQQQQQNMQGSNSSKKQEQQAMQRNNKSNKQQKQQSHWPAPILLFFFFFTTLNSMLILHVGYSLGSLAVWSINDTSLGGHMIQKLFSDS